MPLNVSYKIYVHTKYMKIKTHIAKDNSIESCFHFPNSNSVRMIGCRSVSTYKNNTTKIQDVLNIKRDSSAKRKKNSLRSKIKLCSSNSNCNSNLASHTQTKQTIYKTWIAMFWKTCNTKQNKTKQSKAKQSNVPNITTPGWLLESMVRTFIKL